MRCRNLLVLMILLPFAPTVYADEVSLLSGFYNSTENDPGIKAQTISLGGRYGLAMNLESKYFWFVDAGVSSTTYSGDNAPDSANGFRIGGGQKYFFKNFTKSIHTFLAWAAGYRSESSGDNASETKSSGIYYAGSGGFRFDFTKSIFFDIEAQFFNSSLMGSTKTTTNATGTSVETKTTQLQVDTFSGTDGLVFGLGMIF